MTVYSWIPSRDAALAALEDFLPRAGRDYAETRNEDRGPSDRANVSGLSPWIRTRLLTESEVVSAVLKRHSFAAAEKYIQEVCWRTYWKGWLEARPSVWRDYLTEMPKARSAFMSTRHYQQAVEARTGIDCFDAFVRELVEAGYLHNHARMWFASIWIFTLQLPWVLGADFFMRHLLDGDAASNTLSWRWVAGLQTAGKQYVATADNIRRYTAGRFRVEVPLELNPPAPEPVHFPAPLKLPRRQDPVPAGPVGLLVGEDDLAAPEWVGRTLDYDAIAFMMPVAAYRNAGIEERVVQFRAGSVNDRFASRKNNQPDCTLMIDADAGASRVVEWARDRRLASVVMAEPPAGLWDDDKKILERELAAAGIRFIYRRHPWDEAFYPHATKGFFHLKSRMPELVRDVAGV